MLSTSMHAYFIIHNIISDPEPIFVDQTEFSDEEFNKLDGQNLESYQHNGVMPSELDQKLCYVLLEKQDSQIVELESELQISHSKLNKKEAELQTLKDCIRRLTEVSLASASGRFLSSFI